ncbi:MAG TPA: NnrS family protein [Candidatus Angelobacter sp.]|nr:NnrS family protein [Candidatus Angelobacter sp.]
MSGTITRLAAAGDRSRDLQELALQETPAILVKAREEAAQRLMMAYALAGLFFMLLPGTFLGVWNLISITGQHGHAVSTAWIQAHGHAQIFGWIGTFILGIGFYSIPKMTGGKIQRAGLGWTAWVLWVAGVSLRWTTGVYQWHWRAALPLSALLELCAFLIFLSAVRRHRPAAASDSARSMPLWVISVLVGTLGFGLGLLMNLVAAFYVSLNVASPAFPNVFESRFLILMLYAFIVPTIWGFSTRWLPIFLGLGPVNERLLRVALLFSLAGVGAAQVGLFHLAPWLLAIAATASLCAFHLLRPAARPAKTTGVHPSFASFVRIAYLWLLLAAGLGIAAAYLDHANGWVGASRHALTVGFISTMVFAVGQRILPAFAGMRVLYSPRLMFACLLLLNVGCTLRVTSEILAYEAYWPSAWRALPWSAICELTAVTLFAANLVLTFKQPPAHEMKPASAA